MAKEIYANGCQNFLANPMDTVTTTLTVLGGFWPTGGQFTILVDSEYMIVTAVTNGTQFTVVRGQEGSTVAAHTAGALVFMDLTAGSLERLVRQSVGGVNAAARREMNFIGAGGCTITIADNPTTDAADITITGPGTGSGGGSGTTTASSGYTAPPQTCWTLLQGTGNTGSFTTDAAGVSILEANNTSGSSENVKFLYQPTPTPPYHIEMVVLFTPSLGNQATNYGVMFGESSSGKIQAAGDSWSYGLQLNAWCWTGPNNFDHNAQSNSLPVGNLKYRRLGNDGTKLTFDYSNDGVNWVNFYTSTLNTWFTTAPDRIGFYYNAQNNTGPGASRLIHWKQT